MSQQTMEGKKKNDRLSVNIINLFVTCLFLFVAVQFSDGGGGFATKINRITEHLQEAVSGLNQSVNYSDYNGTGVYVSNTNFNSRGMAGLYNLTRMFIDVIVPEDILINDIFYIDSNNQLQANVPDPGDTLSYYRKLVAVVSFLVLCVLLFPLCGLCFCCCRCCGYCGARSQPADKKKDTCKKIVQGTLLIVLGTGLLFCVVCAFGSNQQLQDGVDSFPNNMKNGLTDTKTYLDSTNDEVRHLLITNYREFADAFITTMRNSNVIVTDQLTAYSNATAMTELYNFTKNLGMVNETLHELKENSNKLRVYASQLNDALRKVKRDLLNTLSECDVLSAECRAIKNNVSTLTTNIDFNSLPDVSQDIDSLKNLDIGNIQNAAERGQAQLDSVEQNIRSALDNGLRDAEKQINNTEQIITTNLNSVTDAINEIKSGIDDNASPNIDKARDYINEYGKYQYYVGLGISCVLLLVTVCIALGLICGICGKRPDGYSDNCCNKGAGSQFLLCAVMIMFLIGFIVSVVTIVSLTVGVISEKAICDPIRDPDTDKYRIIQLLDSYNLQLDFDIKPSEVLNNCYQNRSIYTTFNIKSRFDLDGIIAQFNITEQLNKLNFDGAISKNFTILDNPSLDILNGLLEFNPSANLHKFSDELKDNNFTNYSLTDLSSRLEDIISKLGDGDVKDALRLSVLHLNTYNEKLLVPMQKLANTVVDNALDLDEKLKMGKGSFEEAIHDLIAEITSAQTALRVDGPEQLREVTETFKAIVLNQINSYIARVRDQIQIEIGRCGPLSMVINATLTSTCEKVLLPWNGFWFSLFWTIILYVIVIIVSVKLANLYQKYKPYGQYVETRGAKRGKKKGKKSKRYEERPVGSEVAREYAAGSRPPDGRYADMAPKLGNQNLYSDPPQNPYNSGLQNPYNGGLQSFLNGRPKNPYNSGLQNQNNGGSQSFLNGGPKNPYGRNDKNDNDFRSTKF